MASFGKPGRRLSARGRVTDLRSVALKVAVVYGMVRLGGVYAMGPLRIGRGTRLREPGGAPVSQCRHRVAGIWSVRQDAPVKASWLGVAVGVVLLLMLTSCAAGPNTQEGVAAQGGELAGFWLGLWHGIIVPISFVISLFNENVNVYEIHNNGNWYNLGFVLGAGVLLGGGGAGSRARRT
jgi:hypothetical protein